MKYFLKYFFMFILSFFSIIIPLTGMSQDPDGFETETVTDLETFIAKACQCIEDLKRETRKTLKKAAGITTKYKQALEKLVAKIKDDTQQLLTETHQDKPNAVIFDVDDTTLHQIKNFTLMNPYTTELDDDDLPEIPEMLNLCQYFADKKCRIIFLTAREQNTWRSMTMKNLLTKKYIVHGIRFLPTDLAQEVQEHLDVEDQETSCKIVAQWKCNEIEKLMRQYNVIAFIDDSEDNITEAAEALDRNRCFRVPTPIEFAEPVES